MKELIVENSPMVFYQSGNEHGEPVLFLHAAFADHTMFRAQVKYFEKDYQVLTADLLGHGKSVKARKGDGIAKTADWIAEAMDAAGIEKIHLAGVSLGAVLAQDFANRYPGRVRSLACFGGYDINHFDPELQKENGAAQMGMMLKAVFSIKWFAKANRKISAVTPRAQREFYEMNLRFPKSSFRYLASLGSLVNRQQTEPREYPLLIGCGELDIPMEQKAVEQWKQREPDCETVLFSGAGHLVNLDAPQAFQESLERFWTMERKRG
ncbi:alpha/beta fold hydrolase [Neglectibacter caecimuris]|uniref:alpha/beta fold hydrolase n=1 Tax=Neglectibacter caecimuris TaxID=3093658 RepID=UPI002AC90328|nr:alpha/beta hydrolase [Neglectibacter sp. M00184]